MIKRGDIVKFKINNRIGTVNRLLEDDLGNLAIVQFIGDCEYNLHTISVENLQKATTKDLMNGISEIIITTITEIQKHPAVNDSRFVEDILEEVEMVCVSWGVDI